MGENGGRTIRRWEDGERPMNPVAAYCLRLMLKLVAVDAGSRTD